MSAQLNPYISFKDNARQAMEFYKTIFGGTLEVSTFKDFHMTENPADADLVMHSQLLGDNGIIFMGADTPSHMEYNAGQRITMALSGHDDDLLHGYFDKLVVDATDVTPLDKAPWGDSFGMLTDKYGVRWLVNILATKE